MQIEYWLLPAAASPKHAPLSRTPPLYFASLHQHDVSPSIQSHRLSSPQSDAVHPQPHDLAPIDMPTNCDGLQTRRTHDGTYEHASAHVNNVLKHAFPLAETIQHAADAFLLDRRRYFDPERMRAIIEAREMAPTPLMQQVRIARTHTARDARALDPRAGLAHSRPHPMHVHARRRRPFSHRPLATNRARARMRPNRRRARAATARTASSTMGRTTRAAIP